MVKMFKVTSIIIILCSMAILFTVAITYTSRIAEIVAVLALMAALFKDDVYTFYKSPCLSLTAEFDSSHLNEIGYSNSDDLEEQIWFSAILGNKGWNAAKNVTLIFNGIDSSIVNNYGVYKGLALRRAWTRCSEIKVFHKELYVPYGFMYIKRKSPRIIHFEFVSTPKELA